MNTKQNPYKVINAIGFTICGIGKFHTVVANGASALKRVNSALNYIERVLKARKKEYDETIIDNVSRIRKEQKDFITEAGNVTHALMILKTVRDQIAVQKDISIIKIDDDPVRTMNTDEFFDDGTSMFDLNVVLFINKAKEIDAALDKHIAEILKHSKPHVMTSVPYLYLATGSFLGDTPYPIIMDDNLVNKFGKGYFVEAGRAVCLRALAGAKNFRLTDYVRETKDETRTQIKACIENADALMNTVSEITIVKSVALTTSPIPGRNMALKYDHIRKTGQVLMIENEFQLFQMAVRAILPPRDQDQEIIFDEQDLPTS